MRQWLVSVIFAAALLFEYSALSLASPAGKTEDGSMEQDVFTSLLSNEVTESNLADADLTKARTSRVIVVAADPSVWRDLRVLQNGLSVYKRRADDGSQQPSIPILRRDTMRCMVGRVYRPCWEV